MPIPGHSQFAPVLTLLFASLAGSARAQGPQWDPAFAGVGLGGAVHATLTFDDGTGPALYAGGQFRWASGTVASNVARWDGGAWSPMGTKIDGTVLVLAEYDDGTGPRIYAGGDFEFPNLAHTNIAYWDGAIWRRPGGPLNVDEVTDMVTFDNGGGEKLYFSANDSGIAKIFEWDGQSRTKVGDLPAPCYSLAVHDEGAGKRLFAANGPGGTVWELLQWDGSTSWLNWEFIQGQGSTPFFLGDLDLGGGPELFVGGRFTSVGGVPAEAAAVLGATNWAPLGAGLEGDVHTLLAYDSGAGSEVWAGGDFYASGPVSLANIARFDGASWVSQGVMDGPVHSLETGPDQELLAGGDFDRVGGQLVGHLGSWDGASWSHLGAGIGFDGNLRCFTTFDDGSGRALYAGGFFEYSGATPVGRFARWTGSDWASVGGGLDDAVHAALEYDDGSGPALYVGGDFLTAGGVAARRVARWTGSAWEPLGAGFDDRVKDFAVFDDGSGPALYAAGRFTGRIARWTGANWAPLLLAPKHNVNQLLTWDDGTGPALYAAGPFFGPFAGVGGSFTANGIARWDGTSWSALGAGLGSNGRQVYELMVWDDGSGERLYAAGEFTASGSLPLQRIGSWDGSSWAAVGDPDFEQPVRSLAVFDDGTGGGEALYATGDFLMTGSRLARWDGADWSGVGSGLDDKGHALTVFDGSPGRSLWLGGDFNVVQGVQSSKVARYFDASGRVGSNYCTAGVSASGCQAILSGSGAPSATAASGFFLHVDQLEGQKTGLFLWASNGKQANPWGNGTSYICVVPPRYRSAVLGPSGTTGLCDGSETTDMNARWQAKPNSNPGAGAITQAQFWYRDPQNTSNQTSGFSDGLEFVVGP